LKTLFLLGSIIMLGFAQSALAMSSDIALTAPIMVNTSGHTISNFHVGTQIGVQSTLTNNGKSNQNFTYAVQVLDSNGKSVFFNFLSFSLLPNQSFIASQVWIPKSTGQYTVQVFVWDSLSSAIPLTDVLNTHITVN
jgi:hypothetical protein